MPCSSAVPTEHFREWTSTSHHLGGTAIRLLSGRAQERPWLLPVSHAEAVVSAQQAMAGDPQALHNKAVKRAMDTEQGSCSTGEP